MKTLTMLLLTTFFVAANAFSQPAIKVVKEKVGNPDILKNWNLGETKYVNGVEILRMRGDNDYDYLTNVFYTPKSLIMELIDEKSELEALTSLEKSEVIESYEKSAPGGQISLFYCRPSKNLADPTLFTVLIKDEDGDELTCSKALKKEQPFYYKWGLWYFHKTINVADKLGETFRVEVIDEGTNKTFEFEVSGNHPVEKNIWEEVEDNYSLLSAK